MAYRHKHQLIPNPNQANFIKILSKLDEPFVAVPIYSAGKPQSLNHKNSHEY